MTCLVTMVPAKQAVCGFQTIGHKLLDLYNAGTGKGNGIYYSYCWLDGWHDSVVAPALLRERGLNSAWEKTTTLIGGNFKCEKQLRKHDFGTSPTPLPLCIP